MSEDKQKARDFVDHLFSNPNISSEPPLIAEGLLINFIVQNMNQLKLTFKTPQFFPHLEWNQVLQLILSDLYERVSSEVFPVLDKFFEEMDYDALERISDNSNFPADFQQEKLKGFVRTIIKNKDVRYNLNSTVTMLKSNTIDNYIGEIFNHRGFLFNEITRVQKSNLEIGEYIVFVKILLILRSGAHMKIDSPSLGTRKKLSLNEAIKMRGKLQNYLGDLVQYLKQQVPFLSERTITLAVKSNLQMKMTELEEGISRLLFILCTRYHNYKPVGKVDRGAESPDKSWFSVAKKNAEYYGFDKRMLDELYMIAGDNNW
jgi:hypothetical protein